MTSYCRDTRNGRTDKTGHGTQPTAQDGNGAGQDVENDRGGSITPRG